MRIPILRNHDLSQLPIGVAEEREGHLVLRFTADANITTDMVPAGGFKVIEAEERDGVRYVRECEVSFLSCER